jgi:hypothetical protein
MLLKKELQQKRKYLMTILVVLFLACSLPDLVPDRCSTSYLITKIKAANLNPATEIIELDPGCTYEFNEIENSNAYGDNGLPVISTPIVIHGNGATITRSTAQGTPEFRFFFIDPDGSLVLEDVTITNGSVGSANDIYDSGGAILSHQGELTIADSIFSDNTSRISGGAVVVVRSRLSISNSSFMNNQIVRDGGPGGRGGAVAVHEGTQVTITSSQFNNNLATFGGALSVFKTSTFITSSTFTDNETNGSWGGAIESTAGDLTITDSDFTHNEATIDGGAIGYEGSHFDGQSVNLYDTYFTITGSTFTDNLTIGGGGALYISNAPNLTITDSTFIGNKVPGQSEYYFPNSKGSAIHIREAGHDVDVTTDVSIIRSTFSGNEANAAAVIYDWAGSRISVDNSTFANNVGTYGPAGIQTDGNLTIVNSTFSGNSGNCTDWGDGACGVAIHSSSTASINFSTIVNNSGPSSGAAVFSEGGVIKINGSIIANNTGGDCGSSGGGSVGSSSASLDGDGSCLASITADPLVDPLADNGGPTQTHALQSNSPAIDAGLVSCPATDQRGVIRPFPSDGECDLGAFEVSDAVISIQPEIPPELVITPTPTTPAAALEWIGIAKVDALCYHGPDPSFEVVSSLQADTQVTLVGISEKGTYAVLDNPKYPGVNCWT